MSVRSLKRSSHGRALETLVFLLRPASGCPELPSLSHEGLSPLLDFWVFEMRN